MTNRYLILFLPLLFYYFITPGIFLFENDISTNSIFLSEVSFINQYFDTNLLIYNFFSILAVIIIFYYYYFIFQKIKAVKGKEFILAFYFLIFICMFFIIIDIFNIIKYYINTEIVYRATLYNDLLDKRNTHINILLLLSVSIYNDNRKLSLLGLSLIIIFSLLSLSRIELILIFSMLLFIIEIKKKNYLTFSIIFGLLIFSILYRFYYTNQTLVYVLVDPLHLFLSTIKFLNNFTIDNFSIFLKENFNFLLKDFFYLSYTVENYFASNELPNYSIRGIDTIINYPIVFLLYSIIITTLVKTLAINHEFRKCLFVFLLISLFRGHFVHNLGFIIKLYLLIISLELTTRKLKSFILKED